MPSIRRTASAKCGISIENKYNLNNCNNNSNNNNNNNNNIENNSNISNTINNRNNTGNKYKRKYEEKPRPGTKATGESTSKVGTSDSDSRKRMSCELPKLPKIGDVVDFREANNEQWKTAKIIHKSENTVGEYASSFDIENVKN